MRIKKHWGEEFYVYELNTDNEVKFNVEGGGEYVTSYLNIDETIELIRFLETQVQTFNNEKYEKI